MPEKLFMDTAYALAILNAEDAYHEKAKRLAPRLAAAQVCTTEAVLPAVADALSSPAQWQATADFITGLNSAPNVQVVAVDATLFQSALKLYRARRDKAWGLTDCISFVVMQQSSITNALTTDHHFVQAGLSALLRDLD